VRGRTSSAPPHRHADLDRSGPPRGTQLSPSDVLRGAAAQQLPGGSRSNQGQPRPGEPAANTDLRSTVEFENLIVTDRDGSVVVCPTWLRVELARKSRT